MNLLSALALGAVEGLTEFLPVSSTAHLTLAASAMGLPKEQTDSFNVIIQAGAVLAVVSHYRATLQATAQGLIRRDRQAQALTLHLALAFFPTALVGLVARKWMRAHLNSPGPIAFAWLAGGLLMLLWSGRKDTVRPLTRASALGVGVAQALSIWPGVSRSLASVYGAMGAGLGRREAAEFSFLLGLPTLGAAAVYEMYKARHDFGVTVSWSYLLVGFATSFVVARAVVGPLLRYISSHDFKLFGWYRVVVGAGILYAANA